MPQIKTTQIALDFLREVIEEVLENSSKEELLTLIEDWDLEELFKNTELIDKLEEAQHSLKRNLKKLQNQKEILEDIEILEERREPLFNELNEEKNKGLLKRNDEYIKELREQIKPINDEINELIRKRRFDKEEVEEKLESNLSKFNLIRRKLEKEKREIDERPKEELIDELFEYYRKADDDILSELWQLKTEHITFPEEDEEDD